MRMTVPPNVEYEPETGTLSVGGHRGCKLSDGDIKAVRAMAPELFQIELHDCCEQCGTDWEDDDD